MTRSITTLAAIGAGAACLTLGACDTPATTQREPMQQVDVHIDNPDQGRTASGNQASSANQAPATWMSEPTPTANQTAGSPPPAVREEPASNPAPDPTPAIHAAPAEQLAPEKWWLLTPEPQQGRIRVVAKGEAATLVEARQNAVDNGRASLARLRGSPPADTEFERSQPLRRTDGTYEFYVLISCDR